MQIILYQNTSENNKLEKALTHATELTGTLRNSDTGNIEMPNILINTESIPQYNYAFIPEYNRYYFVEDIRTVRNNLFLFNLSVDSLMSFKDDIKNLVGIADNNENVGTNYLPNNVYKSLVKTKTDIINFQNGLLENGEFILITAGGGVAL